jgi:hypothetical protein
MSPPRRHQLRDHLGRFTSPTAAPRPGGDERPAAAPRPGLKERPAAPRPGLKGRPAAGGTPPPGRKRTLRQVVSRAPGLILAALRGELARRLYRLAVVAVALGVAVVLLYQHDESPSALARTVQAASAAPSTPATRPSPPTTGATAATPATPERPARSAARPARPAKPAEVAAAWYAARQHLGARQVRPLQQDKLSNREVRVLVLADRGNGRLDTALVTVRRDAQGRWSVP